MPHKRTDDNGTPIATAEEKTRAVDILGCLGLSVHADFSLDDEPQAARADDAVWVQVWLRVPDEQAASQQPDDFAADDVDPVARKARLL